MSERVLSSFHFPRTSYPQPKYGESEKRRVSPFRPSTQRIVRRVMYRKRLRAPGRLVINFLTLTAMLNLNVPGTSVISRCKTWVGPTVPAYLARFQRITRTPDKRCVVLFKSSATAGESSDRSPGSPFVWIPSSGTR